MRYRLTVAALALLGSACAEALAAKPGTAVEPDTRPTAQLMADFASDNPGTRIEASKAVATKGKEAVGALIEAIKSPDWKVRRCAADALAGIGPDASGAVAALRETMKDQNTWVRAGAAEALGKIGQAARPAMGLLAAAAGDKDEFLRETAVTALGSLCKDANDNQKQEALKGACASMMFPDTGYSVRRLAVGIIDVHGRSYKPAKDALVYMHKHPSQGMWDDCQYKASEILVGMGESAEAVEFLAGRLKSQTKSDRKTAATTLGKFGQAASPALPALKALAKDDPDEDIRGVAKAAIERITASAASEAGKGKGKKGK